MPFSFIACPHGERSELSAIVADAGWQAEIIDLAAWSIAIRHVPADAGHFTQAPIAHSSARTLVLIGEILNRSQLKTLLCAHDSSALVANDAELVSQMLEIFGLSALALVEGCFVCLMADHALERLCIFSDAAALMPAYVTIEAQPWAASEISLLCRRSGFRPDFTPFEELVSPQSRPDDYSPVRNVQKLKPGAILSLEHDGRAMPMAGATLYHAFRPRAEQRLPRAEALYMIDGLLRSCVDQCVVDAGRIGVPLSGGLDSSLVTALASQRIPGLQTFSIGTTLSNEFAFAEQVARHLDTRHQEFVLSDDDVLTGLIESICHNGIYDGLSAEIQAPLFALYKKAKGRVDTMITGYGSDLLFGGTLPLQRPARGANLSLWEQIYRTRWTGEFSPFGASHYGMRVRHPFWSNRLIGFCLDLCASFKVSDDQVKIILREYAARESLLPENIVWRKKIGIHEGSSINRMFADRLRTDMSGYELKSLFAYFVYREFLEHSLALDAIDTERLMHGFENFIAKGCHVSNH